MGNPVPNQSRTVDPFSSYNSNVINKLTRLVTAGQNTILGINPISITYNGNNNVRVSAGSIIKDDVLIELSSIDIYFNDSDFFVNNGAGFWNETGYYYVVLEYVYVKSKPAPKASIKIIRPSERTNLSFFNTAHFLLKVVNVTGNYTIANESALLDYDPDNPTNTVSVSSSGGISIPKIITNDHIVSMSDEILYVDGISNISINLLPSSIAPNKELKIINTSPSGNNVTIIPNGSDTIQGNSNIVLTDRYEIASILPDSSGNTWFSTNVPSDSLSPTIITGNYTVLPTDDILYINGSGIVTVSLLPASSAPDKELKIINKTSFEVIIDANGSETIEGDLTKSLVQQYESLTILPDSIGNSWITIGGETENIPIPISGNHNISPSDDILFIEGTTSISINLLSASSAPNKRITLVNKSENFSMFINPNGSDTIENKNLIVLPNRFDSVTLIPDSSNNMWYEV